jgi:actin-related protein
VIEIHYIMNVTNSGSYLSLLPQEVMRHLEKFVQHHSMFQKFDLPDGKSIDICSERFLCTEALFQPSLQQQLDEYMSIQQIIYNSIHRIDISERRTFFLQIVLAGGNTMLPGFAERCQVL